jgi:predicted metal-dependent hydrolase
MLFRIPDQSATAIHKEKELTLRDRCAKVAELARHDKPVTIWCERNDESAMIASTIPGAVEVRGDMSPEEKRERLDALIDKRHKIILQQLEKVKEKRNRANEPE